MINTVQEFILLSCFLIWWTTLKRSAHDKVLCKTAQLSHPTPFKSILCVHSSF